MISGKGIALIRLVGIHLLLMSVSFLNGIFSEAVRLNVEAHPYYQYSAYFNDISGFRVIDGELHAVYSQFVYDQAVFDEIVYVKASQPFDFDTVQRTAIDRFDFFPYSHLFSFTEPSIELISEDMIGVVYPRYVQEGDGRKDLNVVLINREGQIVSRESLCEHVYSKSYLITDDSKTNLLFRNGLPSNPTDYSPYHRFWGTERHFPPDTPYTWVFWEGDIIHGRVHLNTDIYLRRNSWPRFYGLVTISGIVRVSGGGFAYPRDQIFLGGLIENHPIIPFPDRTEEVRRDGILPFGEEARDDKIAYVTVDGSMYHSMVGRVVMEDVNDPEFEWIEGYNQFTIYNSYPPFGEIGEVIGVNRIPKVDTIWTEGPNGVVENTSVFVPMVLWISGDFAGKQTWASSHDVYLKGDLTYSNTIPGLSPDGYDDQGNQVRPPNPTDYLGIISEESIIIQYGHWHPVDSVRVRPNTEDIYMYGVYAALGFGENIWNYGAIKADYLYPKGSTPGQVWNGQRYSNIDLHMFSYPTTEANRWPPGLDYPYYNPLWPEPGAIYNVPRIPYEMTPNPHNANEIVRLRGAVKLFGSLLQRRRGVKGILAGGAVPRDWNIDGEINPNIPPTYGTVPPDRTGYERIIRNDRRLGETDFPPHFPQCAGDGQGDGFSFHYWTSTDGDEFRAVLSRELENFDSLQMASCGDSVLIISGSTIYLFTENSEDFEEMDIGLNEDETVQNIVLSGQNLYLLTNRYLEEFDVYGSVLYHYDLDEESLSVIDSKQRSNLMQTIHGCNGHILWAEAVDNETIAVNQYDPADNQVTVYYWDHNILIDEDFCRTNSKLSLQSEGNALFLIMNYRNAALRGSDTGGDIYIASGAYLFPEQGVTIEFIESPPYQTIECTLNLFMPEGDTIEPEDSPVDNIASLYWTINSDHPDAGSYNISFNIRNRLQGVRDIKSLHLLKRDHPESSWQDMGTPDKVVDSLLTWTGLQGFSEFTFGGYGSNFFIKPYPAAASDPFPEHKQVDIPVNLEKLAWSYIADTTYTNPVGFRVYLSTTDEFAEDSFTWVDYVDDQISFSCSQILPQQLEGETEYYWKVVPTVKSPGQRKRAAHSREPGRTLFQQSELRSDALDCPVWTFKTEEASSVVMHPAFETGLLSNYPNPFNPETIVRFTLKNEASIQLKIYNIRGRVIRVLHDCLMQEGKHEIMWDGRDDNGNHVGSGVYFYRLITAGYDRTKKMLIVK